MSSIHFLKPASAFGLAALLAFGGIPASALATAQYAWADETAPQTASADTDAGNDTSKDSSSTDTPQIPDPTPVSYTHLDVYKRQPFHLPERSPCNASAPRNRGALLR